MPQYYSERQSINALFTNVAQANNVQNPTQSFNVTPAISQKMRQAVRESTAFLGLIPFITKTEIAGETVGLTTGLTASTAKTDIGTGLARKPRKAHKLSGQEFRCKKTNFDTYVNYDDIDNWATQPNFGALLNHNFTESKAASLIAIAFNGKSYSDNSDFTANPLLQDCGVGWLQKIRTGQPDRYSATTKYGPAQEFKSLDAIVEDAVNQIPTEYASRNDLVVICSRRLLGDKYFTLINEAGNKASEVQASDILMSTRRLGGLQAVCPPYAPEDFMLITPLANLAIYFQASGHRRYLKDMPEFDSIVNYESENIDFIVEEYGAVFLAEGIEFVDAP